MGQRIKGQEVSVLAIVNGNVQAALTDVRSCEFAAQMEILREGYLGETTDRRDDIYRGVRGRMEIHFESSDVFAFWRTVIDRARRQVAGVRINIKATLNFPDGDRPILVLQDVYFGELPMTFGSRSDFGTASLEFEAQDFTVVQG